jgi:hypothetical protein
MSGLIYILLNIISVACMRTYFNVCKIPSMCGVSSHEYSHECLLLEYIWYEHLQDNYQQQS